MGRSRARLVLFLAVLAVALAPRWASAERLDPSRVPEPLKPWIAWALDGHDEALCPGFQGLAEVSRCAWPAELSLALGEKGGRFEQRWHLDARQRVPLPGDETHWPLDVKVGGKRAVVVSHDGVPTVELPAGEHRIAGSFEWDSLPDSLLVPKETGLVKLTLSGAPVAEPRRDAGGSVFLQKTATEAEGERLEVLVHRRVEDDVPLVLATRIVLNVSGKSREVVLGKSLPPGFVPMAIESELPARIEPDTRLRLQVRPGTWTITVKARSEGPVAELRRPKPDGPWREGEEVWVFSARPSLRLTSVEGARAVDPQQTSLPDDWRQLPAYAMADDDVMRLVEKRRGDAEPEPDRLALRRTLWLDFDGKGFTLSDSITGTVHRASRLSMLPPTVLGRVAIDGKDQFITHLDSEPDRAGVEVRQGTLTVSADSRLPLVGGSLPAVGYDHDFDSVEQTLNLPPGFRLVHASGADEVPGTWLQRWTLLELFLVLIVSLAYGKLFGAGWGVVAGVTFTLVFPESEAAQVFWPAVLAAEALVRVVPEGRARRVLGAVRVAALVALGLATVPFVVQHVREGMFPALAEQRDLSFGAVRSQVEAIAEEVAVAPSLAPAAPPPLDDAQLEDVSGGIASLGGRAKAGAVSLPKARQYNAEQYDPNAMVQTGPGLPRWRWSSTAIRFSGPVERTQEVRLYLLSPVVNLVLALLRAGLLLLLFARLVPGAGGRLPGRAPALVGAAATALALLVSPDARAEVPPEPTLQQLRERLLAKPACTPSCASSSRMRLEVSGNTLRARLSVEASATTAVPLPGGAAQWAPERVVLDGEDASGLARLDTGVLWLRVPEGSHDVIVEGALPARESVQIALPLKPHHVSADVDGWTLDGLHEDGIADEHLQLTRVHEAGREAGGALAAGTLPPFVRVERTLLIGLNWQISTRVLRVTPPGAAIVLEVPVLRGESVTTPNVRVASGKVLVNMAPDATELTWQSVLAETSPIELVAPRSLAWTESWRLDVSPIWHATVTGIPVVHGEAGARVPEWRPWPGETVRVELARPGGVQGQTLTIDSSEYDVSPGLRTTELTLTFALRSSRGGEHVVTLPPGATLESVAVNGASQPLRQQGERVTLAVVPGAQSVALSFRVPEGITTAFTVPPVDLGARTVNATTRLHVSDSRWVLLARGPRLGPAVLFWSLGLVLVVLGAALGTTRLVPLARHEWVLLFVGLSQIPLPAAAVVVLWLFALALRGQRPEWRPLFFGLRQLALVGWTLVALGVLVYAVQQGLMGTPEMQIRGNGSSAGLLQWFQDRTEAVPERPSIVSVPTLAYRAVMLAWALWLAVALLRWLRWGFQCFAAGGLWKRRAPKRPVTAPPLDGPPRDAEPPERASP